MYAGIKSPEADNGEVTMYNSTNEYLVSILVNGRPIKEVFHNGQTYVEGRKNSPYSLKVTNNSSRRILAIPSVDGLSVLNGQPAGINSPGYVVDAHSSVEVPGWKIEGAQEAGRFVFKPQGATYEEDETYAESTGHNPVNQGTIGFMIFREKDYHVYGGPDSPNPWTPHPFGPNISSSSGSNTRWYGGSVTNTTTKSFSANSCSKGEVHDGQASVDAYYTDKDNNLGTGWGEAVEFHTQGVDFVRSDPTNPDVAFVFLYDTIRNLRRIGVPVDQFYGHKSSPHDANPFPASPHVTGGCKPPSTWRRKKRRGDR